MKPKFWQFKPQAATKSADLMLYGVISSESWWGDEVTPKQFMDDLKALGEIDNLNIHIFSKGGDPFAAHAIYAMLQAHKSYKTVYVEGIAASAATLIVMAGDKVVMYGNSMLMVHDPWMQATGNANDFRKIADDLDQIAKSMAVTYQEKTKLSEEEILAIMDAETWFTAEEAVERGFADEVEQAKKVAASLDGTVLNVNGQTVDVSTFRHFPADKITSVVQAPSEDDTAMKEAQARLKDRERRLAVVRRRG